MHHYAGDRHRFGETELIAQERAAYLNSLVSAEVGVCDISNAIGVDLSPFPLNQPLEDMEITEGARGVLDVVLQGSRAAGLTLREAGYRYGVSQLTPALVGSATDGRGSVAGHVQIALLRWIRDLSVNHAGDVYAVRQDGRSGVAAAGGVSR